MAEAYRGFNELTPMCGICGELDLSGGPASRELAARMRTALRHRGPDGDGQLLEGNVALGHVRLSIIDVEGGAQPIYNEDGSVAVVFNGEIYNFLELRRLLEDHGHRFSTRTDTEVIVHAYEQWGPDCVTRFNGMFAFALWDRNRRELFIARDHLGIKPLYYTQIGSRLLFASEVKALLEAPGCRREVDLEALSDLFTFRYVPSPRTLFAGIHKLPPAHSLTASSHGTTTRRFWRVVPSPDHGRREADLVEEYQDLVEDAVRLQMRSDVPVGLFLSSGVDSGALLALMSRHSSGAVQAFTIGFAGGERTNEVGDAAALASQFGAQHHHMLVRPDDYLTYYSRYLNDIEEPVGNESAAAFHFVSALARPHVKVALTGQGADEPWAGYDRYRGARLSTVYSRMPKPMTAALGSVINALPGRFERLTRGAEALAEPDVLTRLTKMYSFFSADMKAALFRGASGEFASGDPFRSREALRGLQSDVAHLDVLTQMLYVDTRASLPDDLLMVGDKTSMANSLEARVPFLDYRLVEFAERLPAHHKLRRWTGKYLHKRAMERWLPRAVVWRTKKGFANPVEHWLRNEMKPFVEEHLLSRDAACAQFFSQPYIEKLMIRDRTGTGQFRRHLYLLLSFELWYRTFIRQ